MLSVHNGACSDDFLADQIALSSYSIESIRYFGESTRVYYAWNPCCELSVQYFNQLCGKRSNFDCMFRYANWKVTITKAGFGSNSRRVKI